MGCSSSKTHRATPGESAESSKATVVQPESKDQDASEKEGTLGEAAQERAPSKEVLDANAQKHHSSTPEAPAFTPEEMKVAETAAAKRLEVVFGKMGVKQQPENDNTMPAVGETQEIVTMLRDDTELIELIAEAGLSSFCFALERQGSKGVDVELLLEGLEGIVAERSSSAELPVSAPQEVLIQSAEPQTAWGALWCRCG